RQAPPLAGVAECLLLGERRPVVRECNLRPPCELKEIRLPDRDAFAEILRRHNDALDDLTRLELHLANRRSAVQPGALVEKAVLELESLSERSPIMGIGP